MKLSKSRCLYYTSETDAIRRGAKTILSYRAPMKLDLVTGLLLVATILVAVIMSVFLETKIEYDLTYRIGTGLLMGVILDAVVVVMWYIYHRIAMDPKYDWAEKYREEPDDDAYLN